MKNNAKEAQRHKAFYPFDTLAWFRKMVPNKGPWDYKQYHKTPTGSGYENFSNYNYGYVGRAAGIPGNFLLQRADMAQQAAGTSKSEWGSPGPLKMFGGSGSFGYDPADQAMIQRGIDDFNNGC